MNLGTTNHKQAGSDLGKQEKFLKKRLSNIKKDRSEIKKFMDGLTTSDPDILCVVMQLINPNSPKLTEILLKYLDTQTRRDELVLKSYKQTYELVRPSPPLQKDFFDFFKVCSKIKTQAMAIS